MGETKRIMRDTSGLCCKCCSCCNCFCAFLWLILIGWELFILWILFGLINCITIIGFPNGKKCFSIACFVIWPFRKQFTVNKEATHCCLCLGTIIWIILGGFEIIILEVIFCALSFATIVGIPFGYQLWQIIKATFWPYEVVIVSDDEVIIEGKDVPVTDTERIEVKQK